MGQENKRKAIENPCGEPILGGDDTMSAVAQNYAYQICGKRDASKKEPTVTKDRLDAIKVSVGKYLSDKK